MTELIDSLLEFSRTRASLRPTYGSLRTTLEGSIRTVKSSPEFHDTGIDIDQAGSVEGWFDHRKLERAFFNLVLNACESLPAGSGRIAVELCGTGSGVDVRISDTGRGIPGAIRNTLFEPFISQGKENGTGLGLTVVQKIVQDHGGEVVVERTSPEGTVFRITLPHPAPSARIGDGGASEEPAAAARINSTKQV
jgi:signal transduction histidine kinase